MLQKLKEHLIDEWKDCYKFLSVQVNLLGAILMGTAQAIQDQWVTVPDDLKQYIPHMNEIGMFIFIVGIIARIKKQGKKDAAER